MYMKSMRNGGSGRVAAVSAGAPDAMVSSHGRAIAAPAPRNTECREILQGRIEDYPSECSGSAGSFDHHGTGASRWGRRRRLDGDLTSLAVAEWNAEHDFANQRSCAVVILFQT